MVHEAPVRSSTTMDNSNFLLTSSATSIFSHSISEKLNDENFLLWKQLMQPVIKSHDLYLFVDNKPSMIPPRFLSDADREAGTENPAYKTWQTQDQLLLAWLQSTMSPSIFSLVLGSVHAHQAWEKLHGYFRIRNCARARELRAAAVIDGEPMNEFLRRVEALADSLAAVGEPVSLRERVDAILDGLPRDYSSVVSVIESEFEPPLPIEKVEALLLSREARLLKFRKEMMLTQSHSENFHTAGGGFANIQCQVCYKFGHSAMFCYHRFDQSYQTPSNSNFQYQNHFPNNNYNSNFVQYQPSGSWMPNSQHSQTQFYNHQNQNTPNSVSLNHLLLHVPSITKNLTSVSKFAKDNNVVVEFHSTHCFIRSQGTNEVLAQGNVGPDGLYSTTKVSKKQQQV